MFLILPTTCTCIPTFHITDSEPSGTHTVHGASTVVGMYDRTVVGADDRAAIDTDDGSVLTSDDAVVRTDDGTVVRLLL